MVYFRYFAYSSIQNYAERYQSGSGGFETVAFFQALGNFVGIFSLSLFIGASMGCLTALLTKFTRVRDFPLLESALFVLMSYSTFLIAEASDLTGYKFFSNIPLFFRYFHQFSSEFRFFFAIYLNFCFWNFDFSDFRNSWVFWSFVNAEILSFGDENTKAIPRFVFFEA